MPSPSASDPSLDFEFGMREYIPVHVKPTVRRFLDRIQVNATHAIRFPPSSSEQLINDLELRFFGLRRSGNHAIINWIFVNLPGTVCFLNNVYPGRHHNPYLTFGLAQLKSDDQQLEYGPHHPDKHRLVREWHVRHPHKSALIYSYENRSLDTVPGDALSRDHDRCLGRTSTTLNVLILRDPFNCFASLFKRRGHVPERVVQKWKSYAREFLDETRYLEPGRVTVNYNMWCVDRRYRQSLADQFSLAAAERGVDEVPNVGGGSSFDTLAFQGNAASMRTGDRWREFERREDYRQIFADAEIAELSRRIFGRIPGTESLLRD